MSLDAPAGSGRVALVVRIVWEVLLLAAAAILVIAVLGDAPGSRGVSVIVAQFAVLGLPAAAIALSLRTATPNLAVGAIGGGAGVLAVRLTQHGWSWWPAAGVGVLAAVAAGVAAALLIGLLDVPAWAVSFGLIAGLAAAVLAGSSGGQVYALPGGSVPRDTRPLMDAVAALVFVGTVGGGLVWLIPGVRRVFGARERLGARLGGALVGFGGSAAVAGLAGVVTVVYLQSASAASTFNLPVLPLGAALLGGAGLYGRRGAIAGTALATALLVAAQILFELHDQPAWLATYVPAAAAIAVGLGVSALLRALEPEPVPAPDAPVVAFPTTPPVYTPASTVPSPSGEFAPTQADVPVVDSPGRDW